MLHQIFYQGQYTQVFKNQCVTTLALKMLMCSKLYQIRICSAIALGYTPAKLHVGDNQFDVIAIVRRGQLPIRNVILKQNDELFRQTMRFIGELENGDEVYKLTYTYKRGDLGTPPAGGVVEHKALWGPDAHQFGIEVIDESGRASHKFPDIEFGRYPELKPE